MLAASYAFYALFGAEFALILLAATLFGWLCARLVAALGPGTAGAKWVVALGVAAHVGVLVWFKMIGFFALAADAVLAAFSVQTEWSIVQVAIPVGVSFLIFRGISAIVDVYRGDSEPPSLLNYALFLAFFPYIAAGPVVRLREVVPQLMVRIDPSRVRATEGFMLIAGGLVKKMLVADYLARTVVDDVFATPELFGSADVLAGIYGYSAQIYCDFSGYTDMAIGIALLLGISLPQNFDGPYAARTLQSFWRKWHMTLSRFLRDYLYIPLGGNRKGTARQQVNLMTTMVLGGLWHGAGFTFLIWGAMHGAGLVAENVARRLSSLRGGRRILPAPVTWFLTFNFVTLAWIFFRADSVSVALSVIARTASAWSSPSTVPVAVWAIIGLVIALQFVPALVRQRIRDTFWSLRPVVQGAVLAAVLFSVAALSPEGPTAFIYAGF